MEAENQERDKRIEIGGRRGMFATVLFFLFIPAPGWGRMRATKK